MVTRLLEGRVLLTASPYPLPFTLDATGAHILALLRHPVRTFFPDILDIHSAKSCVGISESRLVLSVATLKIEDSWLRLG